MQRSLAGRFNFCPKIDWYDLKEVDVLVVLIDGYELSKMREAKPELVKVAWMRNWFERWACRPDFESYDVFLCSSQKAARWMRESQRKPAIVFPLATNPERFAGGEADDSLTSDYCFTGSNWTLPRDIEGMVQPEKLHDYRFAVFGRGWEIILRSANIAGVLFHTRTYRVSTHRHGRC